jgi:hypothetical protein
MYAVCSVLGGEHVDVNVLDCDAVWREYGGGMFLRNIGIDLQVHTALQPVSLASEALRLISQKRQVKGWTTLNWLRIRSVNGQQDVRFLTNKGVP